MDMTSFFAQLWGSFFLVFGALFIITRQLGRTIEMTDDKAFVISTGYTSFLMGLVTVLLHNVWVWDWPVVITVLGWSTLIKGITKIGFPEMIRKQAQRFKKKQWLSVVMLLLLGGWLLAMGLSVPHDVSLATASFRDGTYLGYIRDVDTAAMELAFDDAVWLTGAAGQEAAIEAGHCTEETRSECLPNDYFIKNAVAAEERLAIDRDALVFMQTWKMEETGEVTTREIGLEDLAGLINDPASHWGALPYRISVRDGRVTRIEEVYIP